MYCPLPIGTTNGIQGSAVTLSNELGLLPGDLIADPERRTPVEYGLHLAS